MSKTYRFTLDRRVRVHKAIRRASIRRSRRAWLLEIREEIA